MINSIGMIGVGNMGTAIVKSIRTANSQIKINLLDSNYNRTKILADSLNATQYTNDNISSFIEDSEMIFIGVKPKDIDNLFSDLSSLLTENDKKIWVSMAVATSIDTLEKYTPFNHLWIRIMPNTPVQVHEGWISYCVGNGVDSSCENNFLSIMKEAGKLAKVPEDLFDIAGAMAGSGPAFIYQLIEAMSDAGVMYGLTRNTAIEMAAQTVLGSARMVLETGKHPGQLKDEVTSPNGTTIKGVASLEQTGFRHSIIKAIDETYRKSLEINQ